MPKNSGRSKEVVIDDTGTKTPENDGTNRTKDIVQPIRIVSMTINQNGVFFGLGDDGKVYRLNDGHQWETLQ
jgi:hypothetical protein